MEWTQKLRIVVNSRFISQRQLAKEVGVDIRTFQRWIAAKKPIGEPKGSQAVKIANALGLTVDQLLKPDVPLPETAKFEIRTQAEDKNSAPGVLRETEEKNQGRKAKRPGKRRA